MIQKGYVKEVTVSFMIVVGHTHKDIDALFKRIVIKAAVPGLTMHPILTYVYRWDDLFRPVIYDSVSQITTLFVLYVRAMLFKVNLRSVRRCMSLPLFAFDL
eukprot:5230404-Pleurochrysis_carterae.AAC.1